MFRDGSVCFLVLALYSCAVTGQYTLTGPTAAAEGSTVTFTCNTSPVQTGILWSETSRSNTNNYVYFYNSAERGCQRSTGAPPSAYTFDCNSTGVFSLSFPADYSRHHGSVFQCRNAAGGGEESNSITLSVTSQYTLTGPASAAQGSTVTFTCTTSPVQIGVSWSETSGSNISNYVYFYNSAEGRCQRSTGAPPSDYTFDCNSTGVFSLSFPADYSRRRGSVFQCRNRAGPGESNNITLSVTAGHDTLIGPSSAVEGSFVTFTCTTSPVQIAVSWRETSGSKTNIYVYYYNSADGRCQYSSGALPSDYTFDCNSTGVFSLSFPVDYGKHSGSVFQCRNAAGPWESNNITLSVTGLYTLTGPTTTAFGSTVTFTCTTSPVLNAVTWSETSGSNKNTYIYYYNSAQRRCQRSSGAPPSDYTFHCNSTGVFTLSFPADYSRHSGSVFQCRNSGGPEKSDNITLSVTGLPDAPTELLAWGDGPNSVKLSWKKGSNGGAKQHFRVQYKKGADRWTDTQDLYEENGEPFIQGYIQDLKPETLYFVRVQSFNAFGNSSFTDVERILTKATTPAIQTGPTAPSTGTQERNDLDCSGGRMRIHVPQTLLPTHIVTLRDPSCKVASNGSHLLADVGVNECGTTVSFTNDSVIFTNELVATALSGTTAPTIIDYGMNMKDQRVKISCIYPRENRVDFSYVPVMKEAHFYERQYGKLSFDVSQYSDEQFSHAIPHNGLPIGVTLNTELFIDISLRHASHKGVGIMVDSCIATPTSSPADPLWYTVIKDGCPAQQDVRTFASPDVDEFRFSFLVFRFTQAPLQKAGPNLPPTSMVFIHCQVSACPSQNCTNTCNPAGSHRVRREAELENSHLVSAGPFYLKSEEERGGYNGGVVAASVSMAVVATLVAIVALVAWRRSVNKLSKHQTLDEAS